jgi:hypothetical protein
VLGALAPPPAARCGPGRRARPARPACRGPAPTRTGTSAARHPGAGSGSVPALDLDRRLDDGRVASVAAPDAVVGVACWRPARRRAVRRCPQAQAVRQQRRRRAHGAARNARRVGGAGSQMYRIGVCTHGRAARRAARSRPWPRGGCWR